MKREIRYVILKISDIEKYLDDDEKSKLDSITSRISTQRILEDKPILSAVIVEEDWPMYDATWAEIEKWHNKFKS